MSDARAEGRVTNAIALLVEGKDEIGFFEALLGHLGIVDVLVVDVGGKQNFATKFPAAILSPGFRQNVKSYGIIRDADASASSTFQSVRDLLLKYRQPCPNAPAKVVAGPPKVGVYVMPGDTDEGMLENLCLATVADHPIMGCVQNFMGCVEAVVTWDGSFVGGAPNNAHKARAKAFLAGNKKDLPSVGVAAKAGVWNFDHECMRGLREFLAQLAA